MIDFDLNGRKVAIDETTVRRLRANAKSAAGSSSTLNDLAVILERALTERKPVTLRRAEARALQRLIDQDGWRRLDRRRSLRSGAARRRKLTCVRGLKLEPLARPSVGTRTAPAPA